MSAASEVFDGPIEQSSSVALQVHETRAVTRPAAPTDALDIVRFAVERGVSAAELKELVALQGIVEERQARRDFASALAAFQAECPPIAHSRNVKFTTSKGTKVEYSYAELDEIAKAVNPLLAKHGLSYTWTDTDVDDRGMLVTTCVVRHLNGYTQSSRFKLPTQNESTASPQQKIGAAETYAKRRSLISALGLTTAEADPSDAMQVDPTPITEDQVTVLNDQIVESKADRERFLKYMGVTHLGAIRATDFAKATAALQQKQRGRQ